MVMAMEAEAAPFLDRLGAVRRPDLSALPVEVFGAESGHSRVTVVVNGCHPRHGVDHIGTDAAALSTLIGVQHCAPDLVVSAGTAGTRRRSGLGLGDVVVASGHFVHHDRRIPLDGFRELGVGRFPAADLDEVATGLGLAMGVFSTGNSFGETAEDLVMLDASGAVVVDMESAAVAMVGELCKVAVTGVRVVVNFIDDPETSVGEFESGLEDAAGILADVLMSVIHRWTDVEIDQPLD